MAVVMIGVDPHRASHTVVAINAAEESLGEVQVRACAVQAERLLGWAAAWPDRAWAVEGAAAWPDRAWAVEGAVARPFDRSIDRALFGAAVRISSLRSLARRHGGSGAGSRLGAGAV